MMRRFDLRLAVGIAASGSLALAGTAVSRPSGTPVSPAPSYEEVACPPTVVRNAQHTARCGYLTVPESRSRPSRRTIRLFVVRERPNGPLRPDAVLALQELGSTRAWTGPDYLPPRVHREVVTIDQRGIGRSEPSLVCTEVERLAGSSMVAPINDRRSRARLLPAVQACRDRLAGQGVDLAAYNLREAAADAEDLRIALGIGRWNVRALGSGSRLAFEILRRYDAHVRAVWLDGPEIPQLDLLTTGILGTRYAPRRWPPRAPPTGAATRAFRRSSTRSRATCARRSGGRRRSAAGTKARRSRSRSTAARRCVPSAKAWHGFPRAAPRRSRRTPCVTRRSATTGSRTDRCSPSATASIRDARTCSHTARGSPRSATTSCRSSVRPTSTH
jgi:pimeloyl-ACP methyl ester carboxylesterase